jgi:hypothetical protein
VLKDGSNEYNTFLYYKALIEMRKSFDIFTTINTAVSYTTLGDGAIAVLLDNHMGGKATVIINPSKTEKTYTLNGEWNLVANAETAGALAISRDTGEITVDAIGIKVYLNDNAFNK